MSGRKTKKCHKGTRMNKKTRRCRKIRRRIKIIPNKTPTINIKIKNTVKHTVGGSSVSARSFSPSINRKILQLKTVYKKDKKVFTCQKDYIKIFDHSKKGKCVHFTDPLAQKKMLENLLSKDKVNCKKITAPKQILANCWFNVFFMCFFVSDKGRKFFRYLREIMITGKDKDGKQVIDDWMRSTFFHFNLFIEASLQGNNIAKLMDTNEIIYELSTSLGKKIPKVDEAGSPLELYESIISYLKNDPEHILVLDVDTLHQLSDEVQQKNVEKYVKSHDHFPDIIIIAINVTASKKLHSKPLKITVKSPKNSYIIYELDSAIIMDTKRSHMVCCITCNKKEYGFDGESFSRMSPFKWKKKYFNADKDWKFRSPVSTVFNFKNGVQYLFYYRI